MLMAQLLPSRGLNATGDARVIERRRAQRPVRFPVLSATTALTMPSTVTDIFAAAGLEPAGVVRWGTPIPETAQGVYVVALTDDVTSTAAALTEAPLSWAALEQLLAVRAELQVDSADAGVDDLAKRLRSFWTPDEVVLYIGLAGQPLRTRVRQYYGTPLGARKPHAGGWWLKTLSILDELWVHYAPTPDFEDAEKLMLLAFADAVSPRSRAGLHDRERLMPFANLRGFDDRIKLHGITGATGELRGGSPGYVPDDDRSESTAAATVSGGAAGEAVTVEPESVEPMSAAADPNPADVAGAAAPRPTVPSVRAPLVSAGRVGVRDTQRVTAKDIEAGRVRLPRAAKSLLPAERGDVEVVFRGQRMRARWDPKTEGSQERSGVLAFGRRKLDGFVKADEVLELRHERGGELQVR